MLRTVRSCNDYCNIVQVAITLATLQQPGVLGTKIRKLQLHFTNKLNTLAK